MATQPGLPGSQFPGEDYIVREIADLKKAVQQLAAANPFAPMGITPTPDGFTVTGTETINGALVVNGPQTVNGIITIAGSEVVNGPITINGAAAITGTLSLPAGIIGNDALTDPIFPVATHADANNFALATGANVEKVRATVTVPSGYTKALVMATASMGNRNPNATADDMYVACNINGASPGWSSQVTVGPSTTGFIMNSASVVLTGLSSSFYIAAKASSAASAWAANVNATTNVDAIVIFLR